MRHLILTHGDKGGTGKSHTAQLTAAAYRAAGQSLLLVDGDAKNPGLHRAFDHKPDEVLRINMRKPEGVDQLFENFLTAPGDVLVDLPAGGSDMTARLVGGGTSEGTVDVETLFAELDARMTILFVVDQGRDSVVALNEELQILAGRSTDWIIVRNHRLEDAAFTRFDRWAAQVDLSRATILDMPRLDRKVIEVLVDAKANLTELSGLETASALLKMRGQMALRIWSAELQKAGLLDG
jgi:hypothetical protein